jgi:hypothetical protein
LAKVNTCLPDITKPVVTVLAAVIEIVHVLAVLEVQSPAFHPANTDPLAGDTVKVIDVPSA